MSNTDKSSIVTAELTESQNDADNWWVYDDKPASPASPTEADSTPEPDPTAQQQADVTIADPAPAAEVTDPAPPTPAPPEVTTAVEVVVVKVETEDVEPQTTANSTAEEPAAPSSGAMVAETKTEQDYVPLPDVATTTEEPTDLGGTEGSDGKFSLRHLGKRSREILNPKPKQLKLPLVQLTEELMLAMTQEVLQHPRIETSWGIWGIRYHEDDRVVACGRLYPAPTDNTKRAGTTTVYGSKQYEAQLKWLSANYTMMQKQGLAPANTSLEFMFKGHSHHILGLQEYSATDYNSIKDAVLNEGMQVALGPLANIEVFQQNRVGPWERDGSCRITSYTQVVFHLYYFSQKMVDEGFTEPVMIVPEVIKESPVMVPSMAWQYTNPQQFKDQINGLRNVGCQITGWAWKAYDKLPLRIDFHVSKEGWKAPIVISTPHNWDPNYGGLVVYFDTETKDPIVKPRLWNPAPRYLGSLSQVVTKLENEGRLAASETIPS